MLRDDGWFDLMVNGGGPVMLQFGRNPYSPLRLVPLIMLISINADADADADVDADADARSMTPSRNTRSYTLRSVPSSPGRSFLAPKELL